MNHGGQVIAPDVLARYAAAAAREVEGVAGVSDGPRGDRGGVAVKGDEDTLAVELRIQLGWGQGAARVATEVQGRVSEYLRRMTQVTPAAVDVLIDGVSPPPKR